MLSALPLLTALVLQPAAPPPVLDEIMDQVRKSSAENPVLVFDLDSTLFNNGPRTRQILVELALEDDTLRPLQPKLQALPNDLPYLVGDTLKRVGLAGGESTDRLVKGWAQRFFSDTYCVFDQPYPGAVEFVREAARQGATIVYLTGRDAPRMAVGTTESLRRSGFPVATPNALLIMKPSGQVEDEAFKRTALETIHRSGLVIATFENEPRNANLFAERWPKAIHVFLTTNSDPKKVVPLAKGIRKIPDYRAFGKKPAG
jgi:hypothetical protein